MPAVASPTYPMPAAATSDAANSAAFTGAVNHVRAGRKSRVPIDTTGASMRAEMPAHRSRAGARSGS